MALSQIHELLGIQFTGERPESGTTATTKNDRVYGMFGHYCFILLKVPECARCRPCSEHIHVAGIKNSKKHGAEVD